MPRSIYLIGSLKNTQVPVTAGLLRKAGFDVFDDWYAPGPDADDFWQAYERQRSRPYDEALASPHAQDVFLFDKKHLDRCEIGILLMPAGKSGHIELGYMVGRGKHTFILMPDGEPERYDVMYNFAGGVFFDLNRLIARIKELSP